MSELGKEFRKWMSDTADAICRKISEQVTEEARKRKEANKQDKPPGSDEPNGAPPVPPLPPG